MLILKKRVIAVPDKPAFSALYLAARHFASAIKASAPTMAASAMRAVVATWAVAALAEVVWPTAG